MLRFVVVVAVAVASAPKAFGYVAVRPVLPSRLCARRGSPTTRRLLGATRDSTVVVAASSSSSAEDTVVRAATRPDGTLDAQQLAATAGPAMFERLPLAPVFGAAYFGALVAATASDAVPAFVRLVLIQYVAFSFFEYGFHRWCMHAPSGTWRDRLFARWNRLHVRHHLDTNRDMTMVDGYNFKGVRFNYLTSCLAVVIGSLISAAVCAAFALDLPLWPTPLAAGLVSLYHGVLWNRLHVDSHSLQDTITWDDGLPYVDAVPTANRYARWLLTNHVGHHAVGGKGNYNIVFPGPDHLAGTFFRLKK